MNAAERRESVIRAAVIEFGRGGYSGTSTDAIAKRVGVSQPCLFRLFPSKRAIFTAAALRCLAETRQALADVAATIQGSGALIVEDRWAPALYELVDARDRQLMQVQIYAAVAVAEAVGDTEFGAEIRVAWSELYDQSLLALGGDHSAAARFVAGTLINVLVSFGIPLEHQAWRGFVT